MEPVILAWSGGKDSALALHALRSSDRFQVVGLLTTVTAEFDRVSMHGVRRSLLEAQAASVGLPVTVVEITPAATNAGYEHAMGAALAEFRERGISSVAFGDLFLTDIRQYRETMLARAGMCALFPLWGRDTAALAREFIDLGFRAILTCVDGEALDPAFAGRDYDERLLADLPPSIDPCGENGEFHTFVHAGPPLSRPLPVRRGGGVARDGRFHFQDLIPL